MINFFQQPGVQLAIASVLFGLGAVFVVFIDLNATVIAFYRLLIGGVLFATVLLAKRESLAIAPMALLFAVLAGVCLGIDLAMWNTDKFFVWRFLLGYFIVNGPAYCYGWR